MLLNRPQSVQQHHQQQQQFYSQTIELDIDNAIDEASRSTSSLASSPLSTTQSLLPQYSLASQARLSGFDSSSTSTVPRTLQTNNLLDVQGTVPAANIVDINLAFNQPPELMQSDPWALANPYAPKSVGRLSHHRESSLSSLGSAGPASPYNQNTSNPHIAVTDSGSDGFQDLHAPDGNSYYQLSKAMPTTHDDMFGGYHSYNNMDHSELGYPSTLAVQKPRSDRSLLPAPDFSFGSTRSHPTSVASSIAGDSPATPSLGEPDEDRRRKAVFNNIPKLDRTMTDIYNDELYSPNFTITSASPSQAQMAMAPNNDLFAQRLQAANSQHLSAVGHSPSPTNSRERSPFRQGSPLAPMSSHDFASNLATSRHRFTSAHQMREQGKAEQDAQMMRQQMNRKTEPETPKTISPKDAMLEFHESDGDSSFPLFPQQDPPDFEVTQFATAKAMPSQDPNSGMGYHRSATGNSHPGGPFPYIASHIPAGVQVPQQYPFIAHPRPQVQSPPRMSSAESASSSSSFARPGTTKPAGTAADGGTYTCTYHGCTLRFETPALLQKHKREGHRQAQGLSGPRRADTGMTSSILNSQAGPHRCDRINPSTGKPCNTIFSRPYDLTRHEDTIHNARKQKVRCNLCTEEKTFSRADALTRHYRVCHPDVEFPGKHRRRQHHG